MTYIPPKLAMISNLTGYGRCSLAVAIPVVSVMGVQACPAPTALYSNHLAFPTWFRKDLSEDTEGYLKGFSDLEIAFDGIYFGFVGSPEQIQAAEHFIQSQPQAKFILDPAMGDHGKMYSSLTPAHCEGIKGLIKYAHIFTPNLTEACLLTCTPFPGEEWSEAPTGDYPKAPEAETAIPVLSADFLHDIACRLHALGAKQIVITGIRKGNDYLNYISEITDSQALHVHDVPTLSTLLEDGTYMHAHIISAPIKGQPYHGAGDLFAAVICADALRGVPLISSVKKASAFIGACVEVSEKAGVPERDGLLFENCLSMLI